MEERIPFLPLSKNKAEMAIEREFMIDYDEGTLWIKSPDGKRIIELGKYSSINEVGNVINVIIGNADESVNTLKKIELKIYPIQKWKEIYSENDIDGLVNTIYDIIKKFENYPDTNLTLKQVIDGKVDKVEGKGLSTNNFTALLKAKLLGIDFKANNYKHPPVKQCGYIPPVLSVNKKIGKVVLTKADLGLQNVHPKANNYKHPKEKVCGVKYVKSVNGRPGVVNIDKSEIGLDNMVNKPITTNISTGRWSDGYMTTDLFKNMINDVYKEISTNYKYITTHSNICTLEELLNLHDMNNDATTKLLPLADQLDWLEFKLLNETYLLCKSNVCYTVDINTLQQKGITAQGKVIKINGKYYRSVRPDLKLLQDHNDKVLQQEYYYSISNTNYIYGYNTSWGTMYRDNDDSSISYDGDGKGVVIPSWRPLLIEI